MSNGGLTAILCGVLLVGAGVGALVVMKGGNAAAPGPVVVAAQAAAPAPAARDDDDDDAADDNDVNVTLDEVTDAARATILEYAKGGDITEIEMSTVGGHVIYEVEVYWDRDEVDFLVDEDGTFLGYEAED